MKKNIAIHHTAVKNDGVSQLNAVNRYHQSKWNMKSRLGYYVGYNYFIDVYGKVTQTRAWNEETIANKGHNCDVPERCDTISICLADDYNITREIRADQADSLDDLISDIKKHHPHIKVVGHRDLQAGRTCPGAHIGKAHFDDWNSIKTPDTEDAEKQKKIKELQSLLDKLMKLLQMLRNVKR